MLPCRFISAWGLQSKDSKHIVCFCTGILVWPSALGGPTLSASSSYREAWLQLWEYCKTGTWQLPSTHGRSMCEASAALRPSCSGQWASFATGRWQVLGEGGGCRWLWLQSTGTRCGACSVLKTSCNTLVGTCLAAQSAQLAADLGLLAANCWAIAKLLGAVDVRRNSTAGHCRWQLSNATHVPASCLCKCLHLVF